jgi:DNA invertase Pin-like site-specific DNA recombinase
VQYNLESQKRQYALQERVVALGWPRSQCVVIDEDLGISGAHSENRPGYQRLVSMLALREVGIILGIEVSRLARNCLDWYQLLELASSFGSLISDEDSVYDPADFNDRLLLGLKGTISEVELYQIKCRMMRGRINKAKRGDLETKLPIGYERDLEGKTRKTADQSVSNSISGVFALFRRIRSIRGVLKELKKRGVELPYRETTRGLGSRIGWRAPRYEVIYNIIQNPAYAGIYIYGRRKSKYDPLEKVRRVTTVPPSEREVVILEHHEGYVSKDEHEDNLRILASNNYVATDSRGAAREGAALLQGLVYCKACGLKMRPRYTSQRYYYCCDRAHVKYCEPICGWGSAIRIDGAVEEILLKVLNEGTIDLSFQLLRRHRDETAALKKQWDQKLTRLEYESNLARRRYESVDPENRLVACTLESEWNIKLNTLNQTKAEIEARFSAPTRVGPSLNEVKAALSSLPDRWRSKMLELREKKEIIRSVVERVFLRTKGKTIWIEIIWHGSSTTQLEIPKYLFSSGEIYHRILDLAKEKTDSEIAVLLNQKDIKTVKNRPWSSRRVMDFRLSNGIPSGFTLAKDKRIPDSGFITSTELSNRLGVKREAIQRWCKIGILESKPRGAKQETLWIKINDEILSRLDGTAQVDSTAITLRRFITNTGKSQEHAITLAENKGYHLVRLRRGKRIQFYICPQNKTNNATFDRSM